MERNNNQMLLLVLGAVALYFFMKYRKCSNNCQRENFSSYRKLQLGETDIPLKDRPLKSWEKKQIDSNIRRNYTYKLNNIFDRRKFDACFVPKLKACGKYPGRKNYDKWSNWHKCTKNAEQSCIRSQLKSHCNNWVHDKSHKWYKNKNKIDHSLTYGKGFCKGYAAKYKL